MFGKTNNKRYLCSVKQILKVMSNERRNNLSELMRMAWQFVKRNGFTMSRALKLAWANMKLKAAMRSGIVKFYFRKVDGTLREAYGTLKAELLPKTEGTGRKPGDTVQVYYDTEKQAYRCFKKANLAV